MGQSEISNQPEIREPLKAGYDNLVRCNEDGSNSLSVMVRGVHCAACISKIEGTLNKDKNTKSARLNFSTGRLSVQWNGSAAQANDYVGAVEALGYDVLPYDSEKEEGNLKKEERFLLLCLGVAGFAMGNIMLLSVGLWTTSGAEMGGATRGFLHWISAAIALPAILFAGRPFFRSALTALSAGQTNMDLPISVALILAGGMSLFGTITHSEHVYFDSAVMLIFFLLIGRYLDFRARKAARSAATDLLGTLSGFANVVKGGKLIRIPVQDLKEKMVVRIGAGEKAPIDGVVSDGESEIDTSLITGETLPRLVKKGGVVYAGTLNLSAPLNITVLKRAEDSLLAEIIRLMEKAEQGQAKYVRVADRAARLYTPVVHMLALLAFFGWLFIAGIAWQQALMIAITVLIITCPCALGLAVPVVQVLASGRLMKKGVLIKSGDALERLAAIDTVLLDKTGTLTRGKPVLEGKYSEIEMSLAASLASHSTHPLSKAISYAYEGKLYKFSNVKEVAGKGLEGFYDGKKVKLGSRAFCGDKKAPHDEVMELWLKCGRQTPVRFIFNDELRGDAPEVITALKSNKLMPVMATGDRENVAKVIAKKCAIDEYYAEQTPPEKYAILERLKSEGHKVLMVGDGLNDAPVLAGADVSMAPGSAIDMAQNAADIVFMGEDLSPVADTYKTACITQKLVKQNFVLAIFYNCIAIPFALAGLVTPLGAALAMSGSSLLVIANSFRLKLDR
jgi:Cu2+-exporting ATPase